MRLEARLTASNGRIVAWVLVVDERTVAFDHRNGEAVSDRATRRLWMTVEMWTRCGCVLRGRPLASASCRVR